MFTVIIPVHNKAPHLRRSIESVLDQTFDKLELILVNDASTDGSEEIIESYQDSRIKILSRSEAGPGGYAARNLGIKQAEYDWIAFLDADDEWCKDYLLEIYECIKHHPETGIITTNWEKVSEHVGDNYSEEKNRGNIYSEFYLIDYLRKPKFIWTGAVVAHKSIINHAGGFPTDKLCKRGGDVDTWVRWLDSSTKNIFINKVLSFYYQGTVNQVTKTPNTHFCAYETLKKIHAKNKGNKELKQAIEEFSNVFVYNMLARQVKFGMPINCSEFGKFYFDKFSFLRIGKLFSMRLKYLIGLQ